MAFFLLPSWLASASLASGVLGVASHRLVWIRGDWDHVFWKIAVTFLSAQPFAALSMMYLGLDLLTAIVVLAVLELTHVVSLFTSIAVYRLFFHHLRRFPGPFWARLSMAWRLKRITFNEENFQLVDRLHRKYGDFVRLGESHDGI